ncbi:MAG: DUF4337 domain-containing protein [Hyphomicrobiaceae bacterium]
MALADVTDAVETARSKNCDRWIAIYIAVVAVILSIASVAGDNAMKESAKANLDATNLWAFFQAKNIRRTNYMIAAEELELRRLENPDMPPAARAKIDAMLAEYRNRITIFTSDKERMEGLDELFVRAKAKEVERDIALKQDPYFDTAQALLQIAIVLGSVAIVTGGSLALSVSIILAIIGSLATLNGFTLAVDVEALAALGFGELIQQLVDRAGAQVELQHQFSETATKTP